MKNKYLLLLLSASTFTTLLYEIVWNKTLSLLLGATITASVIVLSAIMAGIGFGAFYGGKKVSKGTNIIKFISKLLILSGLTALLGFYILKNLDSIYSSNIPFQNLIIQTISYLIVFVTSFLSGTIFPVISHLIISSKKNRSNFGLAYAVDTIGSFVGGIATGFIFLRFLGTKQSLILGVSINLISALFIIFFTKKDTQKLSKQEIMKKIKIPSNVAIFTFICGFSGLGLQILFIRVFRIYLTNTTYTFSVVASIFILGLFVGSSIFKLIYNKISEKKAQLLLPITLLFFGISILISLFFTLNAPDMFIYNLYTTIQNPTIRLILPTFILAFSAVFLFSTILGFSFPLACSYAEKYNKTINPGETIGNTILINTIGSILGPIVAAFIFIPFLGVGKSIILIAILNIALAISYMIISHKSNFNKFQKTNKIIGITIFFASFLILFIIPQIKILPPSFSQTKKNILFYKEAIEGTIVVGKEPTNSNKKTYINNNQVIGSTYDAVKAVKMIGNIPFLAGLKAKKVLIVGFGIGVTTSSIAEHKEIERIDCIELVSDLKLAADIYKDLNNNIIADKRLHIKEDDGRHFLLTTKNKYDLITSDPTHPILGSGNLYSKEYFELCSKKLTPSGMVCQYLPIHKLRLQDFLGIVKTFKIVFPNSTLWIAHSHAILLGKKNKNDVIIDFKKWENNAIKIKDKWFYSNPYSLANTVIFDSEKIDEIIDNNNLETVTDNKSYLDFFSPASLYPQNWTINTEFLLKNRINPTKVFYDIDNINLFEKFYLSGNFLIKALIAYNQRDIKGYINYLKQGYKINPENKELPFLIKSVQK